MEIFDEIQKLLFGYIYKHYSMEILYPKDVAFENKKKEKKL